MASVKLLGQVQPTGGAGPTALYHVPSDTQTVISTLFVANTSSSDVKFSIYACASGDAGTDTALFYQVTIAANSTYAITSGITLEVAKYIYVENEESSGTALTFTAFGEESEV